MNNLCGKCPEYTRGLCCHMNIHIGKFNVILENVPCNYLDLDTMKCTVYDKRKEIASWCLKGKELFGKGALPKECLYLLENPTLESNPKRLIKEILETEDLTQKEKMVLVGMYNTFNNIPFNSYIPYTVK